ncbi:MAG: DUF11 domain-containing protein [Trueperaceae bacterium]|nr:DUF11 domain-containing protein [Trueperaceae bacterium]
MMPEAITKMFEVRKRSCWQLAARALLATLVALGFASAQPVPTATVGSATGFLGSEVTVPVSFWNGGAGLDVGYGPYLDLVLPTSPDPLEWAGAEYLGRALEQTVVTFGPTGQAQHPFALAPDGSPLVITGPPGGQLVVLTLPFGSVTVGQPSLDIDVHLRLSPDALPDTAIPVQVVPGFRYGADPLDNNGADPQLRGATSTTTVTPALTLFAKDLGAPEHDTPVGESFTHGYELTFIVAPGQTLTGVELTDALPTALVIRGGSLTVSVDGVPAAHTTDFAITSAGVAGGADPAPFPVGDTGPYAAAEFTVRLTDPVTAPPDQPAVVVVAYSFYIPSIDANGLQAGAGGREQSLNQAAYVAHWTGNGAVPAGRDLAGESEFEVDIGNTADYHPEQANGTLRLQKWVGARGGKRQDVRPGDVVTFVLDLQVSDVSVFDDVVIVDRMEDGLEYVPGSLTLDSYTRRGVEHGGVTSDAYLSTATNADGSVSLSIDLSAWLADLGQLTLTGACVDDSFGGVDHGCLTGATDSTTGTISYRARVLNDYRVPVSSDHVVQNDVLTNEAVATGEIVDAYTGLKTGRFDSDGGDAHVVVVGLETSKAITFVDGVPPSGAAPPVSNGDLVTFRLRTVLGALSFKDLVVSDYVPLPVFAVPAALDFVGECVGVAPAVNEICYGPGSTFAADVAAHAAAGQLEPAGYDALARTVTVDADSNSFHVDFGELAVVGGVAAPSVIELLVTLEVSDTALADGLYITNMLQASDSNSRSRQSIDQETVQLQYTRPALNISNGVIAVTGNSAFDGAPLGLPVTVPVPLVSGSDALQREDPLYDLDVHGLDALDVATILVIVENHGRGKDGAYDVRLRESLPLGLSPTDVVAGSLSASRGDGAAVALPAGAETALFSAAGLFLPGPVLERAVMADGTANDTGSNILYLTYQVRLPEDTESRQSLTIVSAVTEYAAQAGGNNLTGPGLITDGVTISVVAPAVLKRVVATSEAHSPETGTARPVAVGEVVRYRLEITVPEGQTSDLVITDALPNGLAYQASTGVRLAAVSQAAGALSLHATDGTPWLTPPAAAAPPAGVLDAANSAEVPAARVGLAGTTLTLSLGDVRNAADDAAVERLVLEFNVLVRNVAANNGTAGVNNAARLKRNAFTATHGPARLTVTSAEAQVRVTEPRLSATKTVDPAGDIDAGDAITYTVILRNAAADSLTAFDLELVDELPAHVVYGSHTLTSTGAVGAAASVAGSTITVNADSLASGGSVTLTIQATLATSVPSGTNVLNTATYAASSLPGDHGTATNPTGGGTPGAPGTADGEREYAGSASVSFLTRGLAPRKSVVGTSEAHTSGTNVTVGEVVRYRLEVSVPEGVNDGYALVDQLPAGLTLSGTPLVRVALHGTGLAVAADLLGALTGSDCPASVSAPTFALPSTRVVANGQQVTFDLGDVTNANLDDSPTCVVIEFNATVTDVAAAVAGAGLTNTFSASANGVNSPSATSTVTVVEPVLTVAKSVDAADGALDAGDLVTYTIGLSHAAASTADAFDLTVEDTLPSELTDLTVTGVAGPAGAAAAIDGAGVLTVTAQALALGEVVTVTVTGRLVAGLEPGTAVDNVASLTWTGLPEDGTAAGDPGNETGSASGPERAYGPVTDDASFTTRDLSLAKGVQATSEPHTAGADVVIGEVVRYRLVVGLPEGVTTALHLDDVLPSGLTPVAAAGVRAAFVAAGATVSGAALAGAPTYAPAALPNVLNDTNSLLLGAANVAFAAGGVTLQLGDVTNAASDAAEEFLVLEYNVVVATDAANQDGVGLTNRAAVSSGGTERAAAEATVTVREPALSITKGVVSGSTGWSSTGEARAGLVNADIGETVTFAVTLTNAAGAVAAQQVVVSDAIPAEFTLLAVRVTLPGGAVTTVPAPSAPLEVALPALQPGEALLIEYDVLVTDAVAAGQVVENTATYTASSLTDPPDDAHNQTGSPSGAERTYTGSAEETVEMAEPLLGLAKAVAAGPATTDGGVYDLTFRFVARNLGSSPLAGVVVTDDLGSTFPSGSGVSVLSATVTSVTIGGAAVAGANPGYGAVSGGVTDHALLLPGTVGLAPGEEVVILLDVSVQLADVDALGTYQNSATATGTTPGGIPAPPAPSANGGDPTATPGPTPVTFTETAGVALTKEHLAAQLVSHQDGSFTLQYWLVVTNTGPLPLRDLRLEDDLAAAFGAGSSITAASVAAVTPGTTLVPNAAYDGVSDTALLDASASWLPAGAEETLILTVTVVPEHSGVAYSNAAGVTGATPLGRDVTAGASDTVEFQVAPDLVIGTCLESALPTATLGTYAVRLAVRVENRGDLRLDDASAVLDLNAVFAAADSYVLDGVSAATGSLVAPAAGYGGAGGWELLPAGTTLYTADQAAADATLPNLARFALELTVVPGNQLHYQVNATAEGQAPLYGVGATSSVTATASDWCDPAAAPSGNPTVIDFDDDPSIGVAKRFVDVVAVTGQPGAFDVTFEFALRNFGQAQLNGVSLHDDLGAAFADGTTWLVTSVTATAPLVAVELPVPAQVTEFLAPTSFLGSQGQTNDTGTVTVTVRAVPVDPSTTYLNRATASGENPDGDRVADDSVDGTDPDPDGDGDPRNDVSPTPFTFETPIIGLAKGVPSTFDFGAGAQANPRNVGDGTYQVAYEFTLRNHGDVPLHDLYLTDDLLTQLAVAVPESVTAVSGSLAANPAYDGAAGSEVLAAGQTLGYSATELVTGNVFVVVTLRPGAALASGSLELANHALAQGTSPGGQLVTDDSNAGTDPDAGQPDGDDPALDGDGDPTNNAGPTTATITEDPVLGVAKSAAVTPVGDGRFDVRFDFVLTNYGDVELRGLQLEDDLEAAFGPGTYTVLSLYSPTLAVNAVAPDPAVPTAFDGGANRRLLLGTDTLAAGASAAVRLVVRVTPQRLGLHTNQAVGSGTSPGGRDVTDRSTDGLDPDPDGDGVPDEDVPTPVTFGEAPLIGLAKSAAVTMNDDGSFDIELTFTVRNMGDVPLRGLRVTDPLTGIYAITDLTPERVSAVSSTLTVNPAYDGRSDPEVLMGNDVLAVGAERQVSVRLRSVRPTTATSTTNSAVAGGTSPNGTPVSDRSTDGLEPDPDGDGVPSEEVPTPIDLSAVVRIALAKRGSVVVNASGSFDVTFVLTVANVGNTTLRGVQVVDDLADYYAGTDLTPAQVSVSSSDFTASPSYDGAADQRMLSGTDSLPVGGVGTITVTLTGVTPHVNGASLVNSALATASGPGGNRTSDRSNDGTTPEAGVDVPTTLELVARPLLGVAKAAAVSQAPDGTFTVRFTFVLTNQGNADLVNLSLEDDLSDFYADAGLTAAGVSTASADLLLNPAYDGLTDTELLGPGAGLLVGQRAELTLTLSGLAVQARTSFTNQAEAGGETPSGTPAPPERSTDGLDPDPDGNGDPTDDSEPTPVELVAEPRLGVAKSATVSQNPGGSYRVEFTLRLVNMGNGPLRGLSLEDDLSAFYAGTDLAPSAVSASSADLPVNPGFDGLADMQLLAPGATLAAGAEAVVSLVLDPVTPTTQTSFLNSALGAGSSPDGTPTQDTSQDGADPDPDGDGDPTNDDAPTPVVLEPAPRVGVAKRAAVTANPDGTFDVTFEFVVGNYGNTPLVDLQVRDDLSVIYSLTDLTPAQVSVTSSDLATNPGYDGLADPRLLAPGNSLAVGARAAITLTLTGFRLLAPVDTLNTAIATGASPDGTPAEPDASTDDTDPDPDGDGDPGNDSVPTPVRLGQAPAIGLAKAAAQTRAEGGSYDVVFTLLVRNYGDAPLLDLSITDPLTDFYAGTDLTPAGVSVASGDLAVNPAFDGRSDVELLAPGNSLPVGGSATLTIRLAGITPAQGVTRIDNSAFATGTAPDGTEVADTSTNGDDPDPSGRGPSYHSEPTPVDFEALADMLLTKQAAQGPFAIGDRVAYTVVVVNPNDVATAFDLTDRLPQGTVYVAGTAAFAPPEAAPTGGAEPEEREAGVLSWRGLVLAAGERLTVTYELRVAPGAPELLVNAVELSGNTGHGAPIRATANAAVSVERGVFELEEATLIGRVYFDVDRDDRFTHGIDAPLAGVRVVLSNGWQTLTDAMGNYAFRDLEAGPWTVMVDRMTAPYTPRPHPEQLRDPRQHLVNVRGLTVSDFPFGLPEGLAGAVRETVITFGPVSLRKSLLQLPDAVRVVLEVDFAGDWPAILITDPVPGGEARTFVVAPAEPATVITYDLPLGSQLTDPEIEWSYR